MTEQQRDQILGQQHHLAPSYPQGYETQFDQIRRAVNRIIKDCADGEEPAFTALYYLTGAVLSVAHGIAESAHSSAPASYHNLVTYAVALLNSSANREPDLFRRISREELEWPGFLYPWKNPPRKSSWQSSVVDQEELIRKLELGQAFGIKFSGKGKRASFKTLEVRIALELIRRVRYEVKMGEARVSHLPPFGRRTYGKWWKAAEELFLEAYGKDYEAHADFASYSSNVVFCGNKARIRSEIKKKLKQAFRSIAAE